MKTGKEIRNYLDEYKFKHANVGFQYAETAIKLCMEEPKYRLHTMQLYQKIAEIFNVTHSCVERGIRHAIETSTY